MYSRAIRFGNAVLAYDVQGTGPRALLTFHGAGQDRSVFHHLPLVLSSTYRIYSFDLFFHGESQWNSSLPVSKAEWRQLIQQFSDQEQVDKFTVLGYSIGARFALATLEMLPDLTAGCFLIAPDGLTTSPWFRLATGSVLGRNLFRRLMSRPESMHRLFRMAGRTGMLDAITARFFEHQLDNDVKRERVYRSWTTFRLLRFDLPALQHAIRSHEIFVYVFLALHDRIIPIDRVQAFLKRLKSGHLEIVDTNHRRILNDALMRIAGS